MTEEKKKKFTFDHMQWKPGEEQPKQVEVDLAQLERLEESREHLERVRREGQIGHFQTRPHAGAILSDMYAALWAELARLRQFSLERPLEAHEFKRMIDLGNTIPKIMREEREQNKQEQEELDHMSREDMAKELRQLAHELEGNYVDDAPIDEDVD